MDVLPLVAKLHYELCQLRPQSLHLSSGKSIVLANDNWSVRTVQLEHRIAIRSFDVHMLRPMIVGINNDSPTVDAQNCRHEGSLVATQTLGYLPILRIRIEMAFT